MIPAIHEILSMLLSGQCTKEQASAWIEQHLKLAELRDEAEPYLTIAMGHGRYEIGAGTNAGLPCVFFGSNGSGVVGELITAEPRQTTVEETVAVITFANVEGLNVLQEKMDEVRALHFSPAATARESALVAERDAALSDAKSWEEQASDRLAEWDKMRAERDALRAALQKARKGLGDGLWDFGPGQDEHEACESLCEEIDAVLAAPAVEG